MDRSSDSFGMPPVQSSRQSPVRYLESVKASGPAMKHVLYVEVVPKGFVKIEHVSDSEDSEQDPLMTVSPSPHPPPTLLPTKRKKSKEKHQQRQEKRERKLRERDVKHRLEEINNKECNQIQREIKEEIKEEERYNDKQDSIDGYNSPFSGLHSPDRSSSPDWPPSPKKKPARRKKKDIDHTSSSFACNRSNCDFTTMELTELNSHKKNDHKGRKDFQCDQCIYRGATASDLRKHYRQHSGEIPYSCKMSGCNFRAKHNNSLVYHTKKYHPTGEPIKCDASEACIFTTYLKAALKHHKMMQHGGGKSLACEICPYKCYLMADLRKHHRVHTGENPYACDFEGCRYACKISSNLKKHKRIHTEEKPYFCDACDFRTNFINSLKVHKRTHTNERPYCCEQCGYRCNHTSNLKKHVARLHPGATYNIVRRPCLETGTGAGVQTDS